MHMNMMMKAWLKCVGERKALVLKLDVLKSEVKAYLLAYLRAVTKDGPFTDE
jgi:hypothetical protein